MSRRGGPLRAAAAREPSSRNETERKPEASLRVLLRSATQFQRRASRLPRRLKLRFVRANSNSRVRRPRDQRPFCRLPPLPRAEGRGSQPSRLHRPARLPACNARGPRTIFTASRKIESASSDHRRIFAKAMPRREIGRDAALLKRAICRNRDGQNRGLRVFRLLQRFFGAFAAELEERKAERSIRLVEDGARFRIFFGEVASHAGILRRLSGK